MPVTVESEPLEPNASRQSSPSAVRPALALTAAEEVETIRRVLLEAATSTTRETWATCTCPECGKGFRQEISVPDHGARIKAVEALLREGLGRVGDLLARTRTHAYYKASAAHAALAQLLEDTCECLAAREYGLEQVAVPFDPFERLAHPEAARRHVLC